MPVARPAGRTVHPTRPAAATAHPRTANTHATGEPTRPDDALACTRPGETGPLADPATAAAQTAAAAEATMAAGTMAAGTMAAGTMAAGNTTAGNTTAGNTTADACAVAAGLAPENAENMPPGADLAVLLERLAGTGGALSTLKDDELISVLMGWRRLSSWAQAAELEAVAELEARRQACHTRDGVICSSEVSTGVGSEISLALTLTEHSAAVLQSLAYTLAHQLPATAALLKSAAIDLPRARVIATALTGLSVTATRKVEAAVLPHAPSMTTGRLRAFIAATIAELAPEEITAKTKAAQKDRRVEIREDPQGTATLLGVNLPLIATVAAANRITALAKAFKTNGDPRTMDQLRADVLLMTLLGHIPARTTPTPASPTTPETPAPTASATAAPTSTATTGTASATPASASAAGTPSATTTAACAAPGTAPPSAGTASAGTASAGTASAAATATTAASTSTPATPADRSVTTSANAATPTKTATGTATAACDRTADPTGSPVPHPAPIPTADATPDATAAGAMTAAADRPDDGPVGNGTALNGLTRGGSDPATPDPGGATPRRKDMPGPEPSGAEPTDVYACAPPGAVPSPVPWPQAPSPECQPDAAYADTTPHPGHPDIPDPVLHPLARPAGCWAAPPTAHGDPGDPSDPDLPGGRNEDGPGQEDGIWTEEEEEEAEGEGAGVPGWLTRAATQQLSGPHLTVSLATLVKLTQTPARLGPYAPLAAEIARQILDGQLATGTRLCWTVTGSDGTALHHGQMRYRPAEAMRRLVQVRDRTCRFPTCRRPAVGCDIDHTRPYDKQGPTCPCNLAALCRRHHKVKQTPGWKLTQPRPGVLVWKTPTGRTHTVRPDPYPT